MDAPHARPSHIDTGGEWPADSKGLANGTGMRAIAWALTGEDLAVDEVSTGATSDDIAAWLARRGWDVERLRRRAGNVRAEGGRWPAAVGPERREGLGPAQFQALLRQVLLVLGLDHATPVLRDATTPMDATDRRLVAELPPHHGRVG